jgi:hypothetical protein
MPLATYRACLERLVPALDRLEGNVSIMPGNEPFNHPCEFAKNALQIAGDTV